MRPDLADIRLAGRVFAPHYAAPLLCRVVRPTRLLDAPAGTPVTDLDAGSPFEALELNGRRAWGLAPGPGLVGYLDSQDLEPA